MSTHLHPNRVRLYLLGMGEEWLLFALILIGVRRARAPLSTVIGERWHSLRELARDIGIAAVFWVWAELLLYWLELLLGPRKIVAAVLALIPRSGVEIALWLAVSVTAGICEETVCRGYLQRQFIAFTGSRVCGILFAAVAFGLMHFYGGWRDAVVTSLYGVMLGVLAYWRGSVRPGMIAHAWQDAFTGVVSSVLLRRLAG